MNETIVIILMAVVFGILGIMILLGKGDFMIKSRYRDSGKFNLLRLRVIHAIAFFLVVVALILILLGVNEFVSACVIVPGAIILAILQYTWAKR